MTRVSMCRIPTIIAGGVIFHAVTGLDATTIAEVQAPVLAAPLRAAWPATGR